MKTQHTENTSENSVDDHLEEAEKEVAQPKKRRRKKKDYVPTVVYKNNISEASFHLNASEFRVLLTALSKAPNKIENGTTYYVSPEDLSFLQVSQDAKYKILKRSARSLRRKEIQVCVEDKEGDVHREIWSWVITCKMFNEKIGMVFHPEIIKSLQGLSSNFTKFPLLGIGDLDGAYSIHFLMILMQYKSSQFCTISLSDLRERLTIPPEKYARWDNFKRRVLDPTIAELNRSTTSNIQNLTYETVLKDRKVHRLNFYFTYEESRATDLPEVVGTPTKTRNVRKTKTEIADVQDIEQHPTETQEQAKNVRESGVKRPVTFIYPEPDVRVQDESGWTKKEATLSVKQIEMYANFLSGRSNKQPVDGSTYNYKNFYQKLRYGQLKLGDAGQTQMMFHKWLTQRLSQPDFVRFIYKEMILFGFNPKWKPIGRFKQVADKVDLA